MTASFQDNLGNQPTHGVLDFAAVREEENCEAAAVTHSKITKLQSLPAMQLQTLDFLRARRWYQIFNNTNHKVTHYTLYITCFYINLHVSNKSKAGQQPIHHQCQYRSRHLQTNEAFKRNAVPQYEGSVVPHAKRDFSAAWKQFLPNAATAGITVHFIPSTGASK